MRKLFVIAISFIFAGSMMAQTTVQGNVKDAKSGEPLPGVNIKVEGKSLGTTTDFDGNFSFKVNQEPPFNLVVTNLGFAKKTISVTTNNQTLDVSLEENASELDEVVVSASRTPESVRESPVTIERMDARDIRYAASPNFYASLENLKGVDVNTSSLTFNSVNTRGFATFSNTRFVQLVDGMDNASPALNFVMGNLVGVNELDLKSVELLPGASSALYGANAFNGILFMTTKNPFDDQGVSFYVKKGVTSSEALGTNPYHDVGIRVAHAFSDKFAAKASFSYLQGTDWVGEDTNSYQNIGAGYANIIHPIGSSHGHDAINIYGDEVATDIHGVAEKLEDLNILPTGASLLVPHTTVSRGGYKETDLTDHEAKSVKFDASLNWRPTGSDLEVVFNSRIGMGNTIFQGTNRYQLKDFTMFQNKLEIRNDDFFLRGYITAEDAGKSYDMNFTGINLAKKDASQWFGTYTGTYFQAVFLNGLTDAQAHGVARANADAAFPLLVPGTPEFQTEFNRIINDPNVQTGSKFIDNTKMYVGEGNYNFKSLLNDVIDLQVGGSYREYALNSGGTIFTDQNGIIHYGEYGAYVQGIKKVMDDRLKFTASVRYDKSQNFDANLSPRVSVNYAAGDRKQHNIRGSFQTGFRNPTTQDQYIGLNAGPIILVGSAPDNLDKPLSGQPLVTGRDAYNNAYTLTSVLAFQQSHNPADLKPVNGTGMTDLVRPEKVTAVDIGYRGKVNRFVLDVNAYYNIYDGFISNTRVVTPIGGSVLDMTGVVALATGNSQAFQLYTNSLAEISSYGAVFGVSTRIADNYSLGLNYTYAKLVFDQSSNPDFSAGFNTPEHKVKLSFANPKLYKNLGFNFNVRWSDQFLWEATAASGLIEERTVVDAMINYNVPKWKSVFKIGGANLGGQEYVSSIGGGSVGSQYFVSWTINN